MASPFKRSDHIKPPDREGPSYGDCLESGRGHMALIGEELATNAMLDNVLWICPGCQLVKTCTEGLAYKGPSCGVVAVESGMDFGQELPPFLFGDASLEHSGGAFIIKFSLVDFVGFGTPHNATCLILVLGELLPI